MKFPLLFALTLLPSTLVAQESPPPPSAIAGNPAALQTDPGTGQLGRWLSIPEESGVRLGGVWLGDTNTTLSGGVEAGEWSFNQLLILGVNFDAQKAWGWKGASFGVQFLQFNGGRVDGRNTNELAGSVQGYNSLPGPAPLDRSQLYQFWYRQSFLDERVVIRIGKQVPTYDFNNLARPVATQDEGLAIPSVTGLLYTPVFVNPTLLGAIGGYYNSVFGVSLSVAPTRNSYLRYGWYDGNIARGVQTGLRGPQFNGYAFHIWEGGVDWVLAEHYPGNIGTGAWYQSGALDAADGTTQNGTAGYYLFGSQRIWKERDGGPASLSAFFHFGVNDATTLPMQRSFGGGVTAFSVIPGRPADSLGLGFSQATMNRRLFSRKSEWMVQGYYQARVCDGVFFQPGITYIPTPAGGDDLSGAWTLTFRLAVLF